MAGEQSMRANEVDARNTFFRRKESKKSREESDKELAFLFAIFAAKLDFPAFKEPEIRVRG